MISKTKVKPEIEIAGQDHENPDMLTIFAKAKDECTETVSSKDPNVLSNMPGIISKFSYMSK